jgi:TonB-dependent starch-binding outer membrane protein SusC
MRTKIFFLILLTVVCLSSLTAQKNNKKITISGYVVDKYQFPVTNANILIDNEKANLVTNAKGYFKVKVDPSAKTIGISTSGSGITEENIDGRRRINFALEDAVPNQTEIQKESPEDEQINVGYGTIKKKNLTTSVNKIDGTQKRFASYSTIYDLIRGQVPGVRVRGNSINIQNSSSFNLSTKPLFIVDGVTVETIDYIFPQMVKSIEVLKGASAAIYGSRGANGVLIISLKR